MITSLLLFGDTAAQEASKENKIKPSLDREGTRCHHYLILAATEPQVSTSPLDTGRGQDCPLDTLG